MIRAALTSALIALAAPAVACDSYTVHVASHHSDRDLIQDVNEINPGLGCRIGDYEVGGYKNSFHEPTFYAIRDFTHSTGFGLFAGIASGYDEPHTMDNGLTVMAGAVYRGELATFRAIPSYSERTDEYGVVVSMSFNLGGL